MATTVSVCVATYKRPEGLRALLDGLQNLTFTQVEVPNLEVVIVDNDAAGSARALCEALRPTFRWGLVYDLEPRQGVSYARNRAVANASQAAEFIAFIDDDEVPSAGWMDALLATQRATQADVVAGPVYPHFEVTPVPAWVERGHFFAPPDRATGQSLDIAHTNNVLVRADLLRQLEVVFCEGLSLKGTEDTHLFMRLHQQGHRFVWSRDASVDETIPASRTSIRWIVNRAYYGWSSHSRLEREFFPSFKVQGLRFLKGVTLLGIGVVTTPLSLPLGKARLTKALTYISKGLGTLAGLVGVQGAWSGASR
jgi:glycosyltransferase involved in cell wall biosynthesis